MRKNVSGFNKAFTLIEVMFVTLIIVTVVSIATAIFSDYKMFAYDAVTKNELKEAYRAALGYFSAHPTGRISMSLLESHGYTPSTKMDLKIFNDTLKGFLIAGCYMSPGAHTYTVDATGNINPAPKKITQETRIGRLGHPSSSGGPGGSSSPPSINSPPNPAVSAELESAYSAALSYFVNHPDGAVSKSILQDYGYAPDPSVNLTIADGTLNGLMMSASSSQAGSDSFSINSMGNLF